MHNDDKSSDEGLQGTEYELHLLDLPESCLFLARLLLLSSSPRMILSTLLSFLLCTFLALVAAAPSSSFSLSTDVRPDEPAGLVLAHAGPQPDKVAIRQATREQIVARQLAAKQGLGKRQFGGGPSAVHR